MKPLITLYKPRRGDDGEYYVAAVIRINGEPVKVMASASENLVQRLFGLAQEYIELAGNRGYRNAVAGSPKGSPAARVIAKNAQDIARLASAMTLFVPVSGEPSTSSAVGAVAIPQGQNRSSMKKAALRNNASNAIVKAGKSLSGAIALAKVQSRAMQGDKAAQAAWNAVRESMAAAQQNALRAAQQGSPMAQAAVLLANAIKSGSTSTFILQWIASHSEE